MRRVPMLGDRLIPMLAAFAGACCGRPATATPATVMSTPLAGRARTVTFECGAATSLQRHPMTCALSGPTGLFWKSIEPPRALSSGFPLLDPIGRARESCVRGIAICGVTVRAPEGSQALACRAADQRFDGPVEVVAPDGSLLAQGYCAEGDPAGTWFWWEHGELALTWNRPVTAHEGVRYTAPRTYAYGSHKLAPVTPETP